MHIPFSTFFEWKLSTVKEMDSATTEVQNKTVSVSKMKDESKWKATISDKNTLSFLQIDPKETLQDMILQTEEWLKNNVYEDKWKTYEEFVSYLEEECDYTLYEEDVTELFGKDFRKYIFIRSDEEVFEHVFLPICKDGTVGYFPITIARRGDSITYTFSKNAYRKWQNEDTVWLQETEKQLHMQSSYIKELQQKNNLPM